MVCKIIIKLKNLYKNTFFRVSHDTSLSKFKGFQERITDHGMCLICISSKPSSTQVCLLLTQFLERV